MSAARASITFVALDAFPTHRMLFVALDAFSRHVPPQKAGGDMPRKTSRALIKSKDSVMSDGQV